MVTVDFKKAEREFTRTLRQYTELTSKDVADAINKKAKDVAIRTISNTPKADPAKIESELRGPGRGGGQLVYRLFNHRNMTREVAADQARRIIRARMTAVAYIKAGWYKAAQAFGARGGKTRAGWTRAGSGKRATATKPEAVLTNRTIGATLVSGPALAAAVESVRADMMIYIKRKLSERWGQR